MALCLKRGTLQAAAQGTEEDHAGSLKRRRFSPAEVSRELEASGKQQPVLSVLLGAAAESARGACAEVPKRGAPVSGSGLLQAPEKRLRPCVADIVPLVELVPPASLPRQLSLIRPPLPPTLLLPSGGQALRPAGVTVDPRGTAFVVTESGYLLAELPACWRPRITLAGNRHVQVGKVAIDAQGTAYLFSEEGVPLTSVPAVSLSHSACQGDLLNIQLLDQKAPHSGTHHSCWMGPGQCAAATDEQFSPSTSVPSPSTETEDETDTTMDWESV